ncbi:acyltransferase family protein [Steroidobacter flavus]|uniref:Acyltransferase family protein n=1 Tax=Steroidobacter flavus TaxID=1842136 RepID=A0ABV8SKM8_9GAMM
MDWLRDRFEFERDGGGHTIRPMEGLRGFAVLLVFLVHYESLLAPWIAHDAPLVALAHALETIGYNGVDLFFVLSGYLIYGSLLSRRQSFQKYFARRLRRIYPAFTVVFVIYLALSILLPAESKIPEDNAAWFLIANYLLLPDLWPVQPMITVAWSLSYEMFCYLALPLLVALFKLRDRSVTWRVTFFLSIAVAFAVYTAFNGGPVRLIMFISGIALYEAINNSELKIGNGLGAHALVVGLLFMLWPMAEPVGKSIKVSVLFVSFFVFGLACLRSSQGWLPMAFSWTPLRWLGNMSYSYYLLHGLVLKGGFMLLSKLLPPTGEQSFLHWVLLLPMLALTLVPSAALFFTIERPFSLAPRSNLADMQRSPA